MAKYSYEFKKQVVDAHLRGEGGYTYLAKKYSVANRRQVLNWVDTSAEHVKELEDELLKLRIENAFLKELRRLRLEDEAKMRERRESSSASEDNLS